MLTEPTIEKLKALRLETLAARLGLSLVATADALERLVRDRWVAAEHGWFERIARDQVPRDPDGSPS